MSGKATREEFVHVFRENIHSRSRTARGTADTSWGGDQKQALLLSGEALAYKVAANTEVTAEVVWSCRGIGRKLRRLDGSEVRRVSELFFDTLQQGLINYEAYVEDQAALREEAALRRAQQGETYTINPRYRLWTPEYLVRELDPVELEPAMDRFYNGVARNLWELRVSTGSLPAILGRCDYLLDMVLHPWLDGCGRHATAMVMWIALVGGDGALPRFGTRDEHYVMFHDKDLEAHIAYFEQCLRRES